MTKVIILGESTPEQKKLKPIEFIKWVDNNPSDLTLGDNPMKPNQYTNIELIKRGRMGKYDFMFAYNDIREQGNLYLGHFNDGVVE